MPKRDYMTRLHRELLEAALDQPAPTPALKAALNTLLRENTHALREQPALLIIDEESEIDIDKLETGAKVIDLMEALKGSLAKRESQ